MPRLSADGVPSGPKPETRPVSGGIEIKLLADWHALAFELRFSARGPRESLTLHRASVVRTAVAAAGGMKRSARRELANTLARVQPALGAGGARPSAGVAHEPRRPAADPDLPRVRLGRRRPRAMAVLETIAIAPRAQRGRLPVWRLWRHLPAVLRECRIDEIEWATLCGVSRPHNIREVRRAGARRGPRSGFAGIAAERRVWARRAVPRLGPASISQLRRQPGGDPSTTRRDATSRRKPRPAAGGLRLPRAQAPRTFLELDSPCAT